MPTSSPASSMPPTTSSTSRRRCCAPSIRIMLIGWDFDARMTFERGAKTLPGPNQLGAFLYWMLWKRPDSRGLPAEVQSAPAAGLRRHLVRAHPGGAGESVQQQANAFRRRRRPSDRRPSIIRRSWSSTTPWRSAVASTSPSTAGTPARISTTVAAVGRWGAATGRGTKSRQRSTARPRAPSASRPELDGRPRRTNRWRRLTPSTPHGQQAGTDSAQRRRRNRAHPAGTD